MHQKPLASLYRDQDHTLHLLTHDSFLNPQNRATLKPMEQKSKTNGTVAAQEDEQREQGWPDRIRAALWQQLVRHTSGQADIC